MSASTVTRTPRAEGDERRLRLSGIALRLDPESMSPLALAVLFAAPVVAAALFYVWTHVATVRLGYELSAIAESHGALVEENRALRLDVAALQTPERLKRLGADKFHLAPPTPAQIIYVEPSKTP